MKSLHLIVLILIIFTCVNYVKFPGKKATTAVKMEQSQTYFRVQTSVLISLKRGDSLNPTEFVAIEIGDSDGLISPVNIQKQMRKHFPDIPDNSYFIVKRNEDDVPINLPISENAAYTIEGGGFTPSFYELVLTFVDIASKKPKSNRFNYP